MEGWFEQGRWVMPLVSMRKHEESQNQAGLGQSRDGRHASYLDDDGDDKIEEDEEEQDHVRHLEE